MFKQTALATFICALYAIPTYAAEQTATENKNRHLLPEIVVYADQNRGLSSIETVTNDDMKKTPAGNGNISDYLRSNPHVRYEHSDQNSFQRGEIKPENISINGADANQTAYFVDNVNVNNDLGGSDLAGFFDGTMATMPQVQGGQGYFFDASMLSKVEVHDSNISASLGGFAGGAVVAKTKQYDGKDGVKLSYRTTNSSWAKLKIDPEDREKFEKAEPNGNVAEYQPKYTKSFFNIMAEKGLTDNLGVVVGFSRRNSHIQQTRWINPQGDKDRSNNYRRSDNALMNFNWTASEKDRVELGFRYSNYQETKFWNNNLDSNVIDYHKAYGSTLAWVHDFNSGILTTTLAYDHFKDKRHSASNYMKSIIADDEYSIGGMGDSELTQKNIHLSSEYAINTFDLGLTNHSISLGGIYQFTKYHFYRPQDALGETYFDGEDNPASTNKAHKGKVQASYQNIALYVEDLIKWKNLELRPGVRIERDNYLKNTNVAPRFVAKYKPWEDTGLILGLNRYYGRSFASMKLTEEIFKLDGHDAFRYQDLRSFKTPYANELSLGLEQNLGNFAFKLNYIHRQNKNRIYLESNGTEDKKYYTQGNDYSSDIYTFQINNIEPWELGKTFWNAYIGFDWLDSKRANVNNANRNDPIILDGQLMTKEQAERKVNANTEDWIVRLGTDMFIPNYNITWSNKIYIKSPVRGYKTVNDDVKPPIYKTYNHGTHTQWDSSLRWQPNITGNHSVYLQLDVLNILNRTRKELSGDSEGKYFTPGREFWLQVGYEF